jgi:serine/threonine protein kinase/formylglycine-generating enzyme required for sulfatase activity
VDLDGHPTVDRAESTQFGDESFPVIPGFQVRALLGRGGMGIVYRAWQESCQREVAVKVLPPALASNTRLLRRVRNEAAMAAKIKDAHVLPVYDAPEIQGVPVIIMQLVDGHDLSRIIRDRRHVKQGEAARDTHPWAFVDDAAYLERVLPLLDQLVAAVTALHTNAEKVVHRDIKPSNVLVGNDGRIWLSDFGLARLQDQGLSTLPGQIIGTLGFAAPEQTRGEGGGDLRCDVFSLGATLYQALTLELPYGRSGANENSPPPARPSRLQPLIGMAYDPVILKALEVDRGKRYPSAAELLEAWRQVRQGPVRFPGLGDWLSDVATEAKRHPAAMSAGVLAVACAVLLGAMALRPGTPDSKPGVPPTPSPHSPVVQAPPKVFRNVMVVSEPPGARIALVPLSPDDGNPQMLEIIRPKGVTPMKVPAVAVGEYLVVAALPDGRFHEVYRGVPREGDMPPRAPRRFATPQEDGSVKLGTIVIPPADVSHGMAHFKGGSFQVGCKELNLPLHSVEVSDYYLDPTEVTVAEYRRQYSDWPKRRVTPVPPDSHAVNYVTFWEAAAYAERVGKRLPDEAEYEYAATNRGTTRFPWGNNQGLIGKWPLGPTREPSFDRSSSALPTFGLFSNVVEWTTSWNLPYDLADMARRGIPPPPPEMVRESRIVRGGPWCVIQGSPDPKGKDSDAEWLPQWRVGVRCDDVHPGLGFRCARSARPRYLEPYPAP